MDKENLYNFAGPDLVRDFRYSRTGEKPRLSLTIETQDGSARLVLVNPYPTDILFNLIEAEELWIYEDAADATSDKIRVEFWVEGFHQFSAEAVIDLDQEGYDTHPGVGSSYQTGPIAQD